MRSGVADPSSTGQRSADREFAVGVARAFGGAVFFALPLLMTMEMWWLGFYMDRFRLALFIFLMLPLLVALDYYSGFQKTSSWLQDVVDGLVGYGVGFVASGVILFLLGVVDLSTMPREAIGKIAIQAVPASFGAVLARSQLTSDAAGERDREPIEGIRGYMTELLFMMTGAVFLAFNIAPTEEMVMIAARMTPWHAVGLAAASLAMMDAFVYAVEFRGSPSAPEDTPWWSIFLRFTTVGYAIALGVSAYVLWTFGRFEGEAVMNNLHMVVVLGFPASLGASAARLIL